MRGKDFLASGRQAARLPLLKSLLAAFALLLAAAPAAHATREPRPILIDHRVRTIVYQPDQVYKYTGHYHYQTAIEFAPDESILTISMGDSTSWMLNPSGFRLFLKPIEQDATTNMTLITNKRTYLFELHARETDDIDDKDMAFIVRFIYPGDTSAAGGGGGGQRGSTDDGGPIARFLDSVPNPVEDPGKYNMNYTISGTDIIAPIRIFDDGLFTYFQFRNKNADLPAFYMTDDNGNEALINFRTRGDYIVVERIAKKFTLRHGNYIVCVFNEAWSPLGELPPENSEIPAGKYGAPTANPYNPNAGLPPGAVGGAGRGGRSGNNANQQQNTSTRSQNTSTRTQNNNKNNNNAGSRAAGGRGR